MFDGKALQRIREAHGLKPSELADRAGVSRQTVWSYEAGLSEPRVSNWLSICRVLEIEFDDLFAHAPEAPTPETVHGELAERAYNDPAPTASSARESAAGAR